MVGRDLRSTLGCHSRSRRHCAILPHVDQGTEPCTRCAGESDHSTWRPGYRSAPIGLETRVSCSPCLRDMCGQSGRSSPLSEHVSGPN